METIAVIDFETTGMAPETGARATEIGVVLIRDGCVIDRYASLMNTGAWVSPFIEELTGISNEMLEDAPSAERVMREVADFVGDAPLAAHNAAFDRKFWDAELARVDRVRIGEFACTLLLSRRLYPDAPSHKLGNLGRWAGLPSTGRAHRALADAELAARLLLQIKTNLNARYAISKISHPMLREVQAASRRRIEELLEKYGERAPSAE